MKIIDLYMAIGKGKIHLYNGLCVHIMNEISYQKMEEFVELFGPSYEDRESLISKRHITTPYWGADSDDFDEIITEFSETRQNMLLLFAAINEEL